jgi:hypothetical protein
MALPTTITGSLFTQNSAHGPFNFVGDEIAGHTNYTVGNIVPFSVGTTATAADTDAEKWAESFTTGGSAVNCSGVKVPVGTKGTPTDNLKISIQTDSAGDPSGTEVGSLQIAAADLPAWADLKDSFVYARAFYFASALALSASTTYHLVIERTGSLNATNYYAWGRGTLSGGDANRERSSTWTTNTGADHAWHQILDDTEKTYTIVDGGSSIIDMAKSTDPETASSFSNQDTANNPSAPQTSVWGVDLDSNKVPLGAAFIVSSQVTGAGMAALIDVFFHVYDFATDTWVVVAEDAIGTVADDAQDAVASDAGVSLTVFSNGTLFGIGTISEEIAMGTGYRRVYYFLKSGTGWAAPVIMHTVPTAKEDWYGGVVVDGAADRAHCYFTNDALIDGYQRTYAEGTGLETMPSAGDGSMDSGVDHRFGKGVSYDDAGTVRVRVPYRDQGLSQTELASAKIDSGDTPGAFTSDTDIDTNNVAGNGNSVVAAMAADGTDLYVVHSTVTGANEFYKALNSDDGGWGTPDRFNGNWDGTETINHVSANVYTRAGTVRLAVVVLDGSTVKYDEHDLVTGVTGTGAVTYGALTVSSTGEVDIAGTSALTYPALTVSSTGAVDVDGAGALTYPALTASGTAVREREGTAALVYPALTASGTAQAEVQGTGAITYPALTASGTAQAEVQGTSALTYPALTASGAAQAEVQGTSALTYPALSASGTAIRERTGDGALIYPALTASGAGTVDIDGTSAITYPALTVASTGEVDINGTGALTYPALTASGVAIREREGQGALTYPALTASGTGVVGDDITGTGAITYPALTVSSTGTVDVDGTGAVTYGALTAAGVGEVEVQGTSAITYGALTVTSIGVVDVQGTSALTYPALQAAGTGTVVGGLLSQSRQTFRMVPHGVWNRVN